MNDPFKKIRELPRDISLIMGRLIVNRIGTHADAYMKTYDIVQSLRPDQLYEITLSDSFSPDTLPYQFTKRASLKEKDDWSQTLSKVRMNPPVPPRHVCIDGHWNKEEFIKVTNANILGGLGTFTLKDQHDIKLPVIKATQAGLAFYDAYLVGLHDKIAFESNVNLPLISFDVGAQYVNQYLMESDYGHGAYIEYHNQPHLWMPLSPECRGFLILGRVMNGKYFLTGFEIPFGYGVYASPSVIHTDSFLIGHHLVVYTLADDFSTVIIKDDQENLVHFIPDKITSDEDKAFIEQDKAIREAVRQTDFASLIKCTKQKSHTQHALNSIEALIQCASSGDLHQLNDLLNDKNVAEKVAYFDNRALREAAMNGHFEVVKRLLEFREVQDSIDAMQNGALALSCKNGHSDIVSLLLENELVRQHITAGNNKSLAWAAANNHLNIFNQIIRFSEVQAIVANNDNEIIREVIREGHLAIVDRLLEFDSIKQQIAVFDNEPLKLAIQNGHLDIINRLLSFPLVIEQIKQDIQNKDLIWIIKKGHVSILHRLLELQIIREAIASLDNFVFREAASNGFFDIVEHLLLISDVTDNIAAEFNGAFRKAAHNGHINIVKRLLDFPIVQSNVMIADNDALCGAVRNGHIEIVNLLLQFDEVVKNIAVGYNQIFREAVMNNRREIIKILLTYPEVSHFEEKYQFQKEWEMLNKT